MFLFTVGPSSLGFEMTDCHFFVDDIDTDHEREGWETISMDGRIVGIRTSTIDEKCQAFDTLVIYCDTLQGLFGPYLTQSLELALPALEYHFHEGVREAASRYVYIRLPPFYTFSVQHTLTI